MAPDEVTPYTALPVVWMCVAPVLSAQVIVIGLRMPNVYAPGECALHVLKASVMRRNSAWAAGLSG
ncbi:Uncharacterised protein [Mycobacteroides abscessus subsp. massiliense]|nr:Uncharacterised protein [Mycobacteroides abscessus subsp. massiliense]